MFSKEFLAWFEENLEANDLMHLHNKLYAKFLAKYPTEHTEADVQQLKQCMDTLCNDTKFNQLLADAFEFSSSAYAIKDFVRVCDEIKFSTIPIASADNILTDLEKLCKSQPVKNFAKLLLFSPLEFLKVCSKKYNELGFTHAYDAFDDYLTECMAKLPSECMSSHDPFRLVGTLCQNDGEQTNKIAKRKFLTVKFDKGFNTFDELYANVIANYAKINGKDVKLAGFNLEDNFLSSVRMMAILAPHWDAVNATSMLRNVKLPKVTGLSGGTNMYADSDIVRIMCGRYDMIKDNSSVSGTPISDLIVNHKLFKQYSTQRKAAVCNFLNNNRGRFNDIVKRASSNIIGYIHDNLLKNKDGIDQVLNNSQSFGAAKNICSDVAVFAKSLQNVAASSKIDTLAGATSFICHNYIPLLKQFKQRASNKYNAVSYAASIKQFSTNPMLRVFSVADSVEFPEQIAEPAPAPAPEVKEVVREVRVPVYVGMNGGGSEIFDEILDSSSKPSAKLVAGDTSGKTLVDQLRGILEGFTTKFVSLYRQLIKNIEGVPMIKGVDGVQHAYGLIKQFYDISITSNKTTQYISGVFGDKDYNKHYASCVKGLIKAIQSSGLRGFDSVCETLQQIVELLNKVKKDTESFNAMYVNSPKIAAELFTASAKSLKVESTFTKEDYVRFHDAVKRLYNSVYEGKEQVNQLQEKVIDEYTKSLGDKEQTINDYYKSLNDMEMFKYQSDITTNNEYKNNVEARQYRDSVKNVKQAINNRLKDAINYFNKVVDPAILKFRQKIASNVLTHEQLDQIIEAWVAFKNTNVESNDFKQLMVNIGKHLNTEMHSVAEYAQLVDALKKLLRKGSYIQFLKILHDKAGINVDNFNWNEFEDKLYEIIVLNSIKFVESPTEYNTAEGVTTFVKKLFAEQGVDIMTIDGNSLAATVNGFAWNANRGTAGGNEITAIAAGAGGGNNAITNTDYVSLQPANAITIDPATFKIIVHNDVINQFTQHPAATTVNGILAIITAAFPIYTGGVATNGSDIFINNVLELIGEIITSAFNTAGAGAHTIDDFYNVLPTLFHTLFTRYDPNAPHVSNFKYHCYDLVSESVTSFESNIAQLAYKALSVDLLGSVDNYITTRYTGVLSLPLHINSLFKGGDNQSVANAMKQQGGSWFDVGLEHTYTDANVIPDATPFYIIAFNIINHYFKTYLNSVREGLAADNVDKSVKLKIHKISYLYPLYKFFKDGDLDDLKHVSDSQFKVFLSICNKVWNSNNESSNLNAKLSKSIDTLFSELNAGIIYGDDEIYALMESGASKQTINTAAFNKIREKVQQVITGIGSAITASLNTDLSPEENNTVFESILANALKKIKETPEQYQVGKLKTIILEENKDQYLQDYYKFMEFAVVPLLTCANAYNSIFAVFNVVDAGLVNGDKMEEINLNDLYMNFPVAEQDAGKGIFSAYKKYQNFTCTVADFCRQMFTNTAVFNKYKVQLLEHPAVYEWNRLLLNNAFANFHNNGKFVLPNFWVPADESSYPTKAKLTPIKYNTNAAGNTVRIPTSIRILKQLFPECSGKTLFDFYTYALNQFTQDIEHLINAFISYPGITDRSRKIIADNARQMFGENWKDIRSGKLAILPRNVVSELRNITFSKTTAPQEPPVAGEGVVLPFVVEAGAVIEELYITKRDSDGAGNKYCRLGSTDYYVHQNFAKSLVRGEPVVNMLQSHIPYCEYTWLDWVIISIAMCDRIKVSLPYKLVQMFQGNSELIPYLKVCFNDPTLKGQVRYQQSTDGTYVCLLTQNILARSILQSNKDASEYSLLSKAHVANIVGILPYLISTLDAVKETTHKEAVDAFGNRIHYILQQVIDILKTFYADISSYTPFIPFMADATQLNASTTKPHLFAELCDTIARKSVNTMSAADFGKLEWANMWFFNNISSLQFPDFKNKNRFEWMYEFAPEVTKNSVYKPTFEHTIQLLGKEAWMALIAKSWSENQNIQISDNQLDTLIVNIINITSECAPRFTQALIDVAVAYFGRKLRPGMAGGAADDKLHVVQVDDPSLVDYKEILNQLTTRLAEEPQTELSITKPLGVTEGRRIGVTQYVNPANSKFEELLTGVAQGTINLADVASMLITRKDEYGVQRTAKYFYEHPVPAYKEVLTDIDTRIGKIINDTESLYTTIITETQTPISEYHTGITTVNSGMEKIFTGVINSILNANININNEIAVAKTDVSAELNNNVGVFVIGYDQVQHIFGDNGADIQLNGRTLIDAHQYQIHFMPIIRAYTSELNSLYAIYGIASALEKHIGVIKNAIKNPTYEQSAPHGPGYFKLDTFVKNLIDSYTPIVQVKSVVDGTPKNVCSKEGFKSLLSTFIAAYCSTAVGENNASKINIGIKPIGILANTPRADIRKKFASKFCIPIIPNPTVEETVSMALRSMFVFYAEYVNYLQLFISNPIFNGSNTKNWFFRLLFYSKSKTNTIKTNLFTHNNASYAVGWINATAAQNADGNVAGGHRDINGGDCHGFTSTMCRLTLLRMIFNGMYIGRPNDDKYIKFTTHITDLITSVKNYAIYRLYSLKATAAGAVAANIITDFKNKFALTAINHNYGNTIYNIYNAQHTINITDIVSTLINDGDFNTLDSSTFADSICGRVKLDGDANAKIGKFATGCNHNDAVYVYSGNNGHARNDKEVDSIFAIIPAEVYKRYKDYENTHNATNNDHIFGGTGKIALKGGAINTVEDCIIAFARGIAVNPSTRQFYVDPALPKPNGTYTISTIGDLSAVDFANPAAPGNPDEVSDLAYLYNPYHFQATAGNNQLYNALISYEKDYFITPYRINANRMVNNPIQIQLVPAATLALTNPSHHSPVKWGYIERTCRNEVGYDPISLKKPTLITLVRNGAGPNFQFTPWIQPVHDVIYWNYTFRPSVKEVNFKGLFTGLELVPWSPCVKYALYSPRKSVYNASIVNATTQLLFSAPVCNTEYNTFAAHSALLCNRVAGPLYTSQNFGQSVALTNLTNTRTHFRGAAFGALHHILGLCANNQYNTHLAQTVMANVDLSATLDLVVGGGNDYIFGFVAGTNNTVGGPTIVNNTVGGGPGATPLTLLYADAKEIRYDALEYTVVIKTLLEKLSTIAGTLFNDIQNDAGKSNGFAFLKGGYDRLDNGVSFNAGYFNVANISGITPKEILGSAYGTDVDSLGLAGKALFQSLFKRSKLAGGNGDAVYAMSLNYFKQTPLSISSVYEQLAFPSLMFNNAVYDSFVDNLKKVVDGMTMNFATISAQGQNHYRFVTNYLKYISADKIHVDKINEHNKCINFNINDINNRRVNYEYNQLVVKFNSEDNFNKNYNDLFTMPSINASYMGALARYTYNTYGQITNERNGATAIYKFNPEELPYLQKNAQFCNELLDSNVLQFVKLFDINTTYLYCVYHLAKQTSFYDIDAETEVPFTNVDATEPFNVKI